MPRDTESPPLIPVIRPIDPSMASEEVYRQLRQLIFDGSLKPGERLVERMLADQFHVSRTPIREALKALQAEGLVGADGKRGLVVTRLSLESLAHAYQVREVLEGLAARLACSSNHYDLLELRRAVDDMEAVDPFSPNFDRAHLRFHDLIAEMSHNQPLIRYLNELRIYRTRGVSVGWIPRSRMQEALQEHRAIYEAILANDPDRAEAAAKHHVYRTRQSLLARLERPFTDE